MFILSEKSLKELEGVHPDLVVCVKEAIKITEIDFGVLEGVRTLELQKEYVAKGTSWTLDSYHLPQIATGLSHAVDLGAYIDKKIVWNMESYAKIAEAMLKVSRDRGIELVWGAVWDKELWELDLKDGLNNDIDAYVARFKAKNNKRPSIDGPHFQLSQKVYKRK